MKRICLLLLLLLPFHVQAQTGGIEGSVADGNGPLPGITVVLEKTAFHSITDLNGHFQLLQVAPGDYTLRVTGLGYQPYMQTITIRDQLLQAGTITLSSRSLQEVTVKATGTKPTESKAINLMKTSNTLLNVVSSEGVAKLPDRNVAEAVQRLPGVVMEADQGEGRFLSFRGTPSDWSAALVNGNRMPVADEESKTRAMNFDIFPSSLIDYIMVAKTLSPDMEADAVGGSANFITKGAPAKRTLQASFGYGYNAQAGKPLYNGMLLYGDRSRNKKFGFLVGGSLYTRNWGTDNYQVFYGSNLDHSLTRLELRDYEGKRTTTGLNGAVEYKFNDRAKIYAKGIYGHMLDDEYNRKTMYNWSTGLGQSIRLQNIHNKMDTRFWSAELGGDLRLNSRLSANWQLASSGNRFQYGNTPYGKNDPRNGYYVVEFEKPVLFKDFLYLDEHGKVTDEVNASYRAKLLGIDSPIPGYGDDAKNIQPRYGNVVPVNATDTMFAFTRAYTETNRTYEKDPVTARFDLQYSASSRLKIKGGLKMRLKEGERKVGLELWERNKSYVSPILYNSYNPVSYNERGGFLQELGTPYAGKMFPFIEKGELNGFIDRLGDTLVHRPFGVLTPYFQQLTGSSYRYTEQVYAAYVMGEWIATDKLTIVPGLRAEYTDPEVTADSIVTIDPALGTVALRPVSAGKSYLALLPMINIKYALKEDQNIRLAVTRSMRRPNFNEIKPGAAAIDYSNNDLVYGNPALKPTYSWNFDAAYEKYFSSTSMLSGALFYKQVKDHIYTAFESSSTDNTGISNEFQIPGGVITKKYQNAPTAYAAGVELSFMSKFCFLPGQLKNIGVNINYSYTHSAMKIAAREKAQQLPRQSPNVLNLALFFENGPINTRLGLNYRDAYLYELNLYAVKDPNSDQTIIVHQDNDYDTYIGKSLTLDYSFSWKFSKHFSFFLEANNLLNTPYTRYRGRKDRPVKTEYYSVRGLAGLRFEL